MGLSSALGPIAGIIEGAAGWYGVAAKDLSTGETIEINGDEVFPLASVFKVAVLVELYRRAAAGDIDLNQRLVFAAEDRMPGSGVLRQLTPGMELTVRDYATLMIILSDNSATDKVMEVVGRHAINPTLAALGLRQTYVSRTCGQLLANLAGLDVEKPTPAQVDAIIEALRAGRRSPDTWAYDETGVNNAGTPLEMAELFELIHLGKAAGKASCAEMLGILRRQQLNGRLPLYLPPGTAIAHKTGTLPGVVNDAGIMYLEDGRACTVAVFSKQGADRVRGPETIARIGLAVHTALRAG